MSNRNNNNRHYHALTVSSVVIPVLLFLFIIWQDYRTVMDNNTAEALRASSTLQQHALNVFETHQLIAERIDERLKGMSWDAIAHSTELQSYLRKIVEEYPQTEAIWLADASGLVRNGSETLPPGRVSITDRDYFQALREQDTGMFVGHIVKPKVMKRLNFNIASRRNKASATFDGVIVVTVVPEYFTKSWSKIIPKKDCAIALLRSDGAVLARTPKIDPNRLFLPRDSAQVKAMGSGDHGTFRAVAVTDGTERIYGFHKLDRYDVYLLYGKNLSSVLGDWRRHVLYYGGFFGPAMLTLLWFALAANRHSRNELAALQALEEAGIAAGQLAAEMSTLLNAVPVAVLFAHDSDCHRISGNCFAQELLNLPPNANFSLTAPAGEQAPPFTARKEGREIPPDQLPVQRAARGEKVSDYEFELVLADGTVRTLVGNAVALYGTSGEPRGAIGAFLDITERKLADQALRESEERLRLLGDNLPDSAVYQYVHDADGSLRFLYFSAGIERLNGVGVQEVLRDAGILHRQIDPEYFGTMREAEAKSAREMSDFDMEVPMRLPNGELRWMQLHSRPRKTAEGRVVWDGVQTDVTVRKKNEEALKKWNEQLDIRVAERTRELREKDHLMIQQSRLATMGEMIHNIAHQWRQPLNTLGLNVQQLPVFYGTSTFNRAFLDKTVNDAMSLIQYMSKTIDDFRDFFKPDKEREEFRVNQVIASALQLTKASFDSNQIRTELRLVDDPVIYGFPNEYSQVVLNILTNAKDALVESRVENPLVVLSTFVEEGRSVVTISDNAGGIPEDLIVKVFDPHFSTKGPQGTGIGLFMGKNIIERNMNGRLTVRNLEFGAEFRIEV
jgi:PAS domain S-box-containing protein